MKKEGLLKKWGCESIEDFTKLVGAICKLYDSMAYDLALVTLEASKPKPQS